MKKYFENRVENKKKEIKEIEEREELFRNKLWEYIKSSRKEISERFECGRKQNKECIKL